MTVFPNIKLDEKPDNTSQVTLLSGHPRDFEKWPLNRGTI